MAVADRTALATESRFAAVSLRLCQWAERWFPDAFPFAIAAVAIVALAALLIGVAPLTVAVSFGTGFWSLIPFTMQMCFIVIGGYVVADSPPVAALIGRLAAVPRDGRVAVAMTAVVSVSLSLLHWGLGLVVSSLLVRALARRADLRMDYRAAGAAAYLGIGSVWALGLSSSAAQLQANPASMPASLLKTTGVIPFAETIFLWQSLLLALILSVLGVSVAWQSAPSAERARTAADLGLDVAEPQESLAARSRPGEWLEYSPLTSLVVVSLGGTWLVGEFWQKGPVGAISNLNTYNLLFLVLGLGLQWRPRRFMDAVARAVPGLAGILIQFPLLGSIASIMNAPAGPGQTTLAALLGHAFTAVASHATFALVIGAYSALLGLFMPSGGGKWVVEAPYVMQAAIDVRYHLGWVVQIYNAAEALPNLINPFWMLPVLGILGLRARDLIGFTFVQFVVSLPVVLLLLWLLGTTLTYHPPLVPG